MIRKFLAIVVVITGYAICARGDDEMGGIPDEESGWEELVPDAEESLSGVRNIFLSPDNRTYHQEIADRWYSESGTDVMGYFRDNDFVETGTNILETLERSLQTASGVSHYDTIAHLLDADAVLGSGMSTDQAKSALGSYTGRSFANSAQAAHSNVRSLNRSILRHVDDINKTLGENGAAGAAQSGEALASLFNPKNADTEERIWVGGIFLNEEQRNSDDGMPGYKFSGGGVLTGYDHTIGVLSMGGAVGYSGGKFRDRSALSDDSKIESYTTNIYATYNPGGKVRASAIAGYARSDVRLRKQRAGMAGDVVTEGMERSKYGMDSYSVGGRIGYETDFKDIIKLGVTGGLQYQHSRTGTFDSVFLADNGTGNSVMKVGQIRNNTLSAPIDITADYVVKSSCDSSLTVSANVGYGFEFSNNGAHGGLLFDGLNGVGDMNFSARSPGRNSINLGTGVAYENDRLDLTAKYDVYMKSDYTAHQVTGNMGIKF